ncbi:hypothetical protein [Dyadobacter tibetensis]|uniref:hypothetical protein n=1 Tax=Dyadobacter tibetensis TaxID=1211851 RepID=UPI0004707507|nr:hypothetical protein [Dyadobacter tibetensis]
MKRKLSIIIGISVLLFIVHFFFNDLVSVPNVEKLWRASQSEGQAKMPGITSDGPCEFGPKIMEILNVSPTGAHVTFHGVNVFGLNYKIYDRAGKLKTSADLQPKSSMIVIQYPILEEGTYKLILSGTSCDGKSEKEFVVNKATPYSNLRVQAANGPRWITTGMPEHLDLRFSGGPGNWMIHDVSSPPLDEGYEWRYIINGALIKQETPLTSYQYQSNAPIRVLKMKTKKGLESVNRWSDKVKNYFFSTDAGKTFSNNVTSALYTGIFPGQYPGFVNPIPESYNPDIKNTQWADIMAPIKLPKGHVFIVNRGETPVSTLLSKGVTHISHFQLPWENIKEVERLKHAGLTYFDVQRLENFLQLKPTNGADDYSNGYNKRWWPNGPFDEATATSKADLVQPLDAVWIGETLENASWIQQDVPMWGWYYKRLRQRYEAEFGSRNIPYYICHNYFQLGRDLITKGRQAAKDIIREPASQTGLQVYLKGGSLTNTNLITTAVYLGAPDAQLASLYQDVYDMVLNRRMGYEAGIFLAGFHEWKPNNLFRYEYPEGTFYTFNKLPVDPNVIQAYAFLSQIYGKVFVEWGGAGKQTLRRFSFEWAKGLWYPHGSKEPQEGFPYYSNTNDYYSGYNASVDFSAFGLNLYAQTFAKVDGGKRQYLKFRIDNGPWIDPEQDYADEVVNAYYDRRGFVYSQSKGGQVAWFYLNSFADNRSHQLEVQLPNGSVRRKTVSSSGVHAVLE